MNLTREADSPTDISKRGHWKVHRGIQVWVPDVVVMHPSEWRALEEANPEKLSGMVACQCGALATERCRSATGQAVKEHSFRVLSRRCQCGAEAPPRRQTCDSCRDKRRRESYRRHDARRRAGVGVAA